MKLWACIVLTLWTAGTTAAPQMLMEAPLESPEGTYSANVEWDAAGFIGRIRMMAWTSGDKPVAVAELPQIKPAPANLTWITENWFACESFVAEDGAAFCYMNVPRKRAYMLEIFAPDERDDWLISYTTNDSLSSDTIHTVSAGHSSLFPILLRDLPREGLGYLSADFTLLLSDAVDSFVDWRKKEGFREIQNMSKVSEDAELGRLILATVDGQAELIYFPGGTTTTREMLALTKRKALPQDVQALVKGIDPPTLTPEWTDKEGSFRIVASWEDRPSSSTEIVAGRFEGVSDAPYTGPGVSDLLKTAPAQRSTSSKGGGSGSTSKPSTSSRSGSSASKTKKPSRSR